MSQMRLAIVAPSGSGKSTTAGFIEMRCRQLGKSARILKLADPLYRLQQQFYATAGQHIETYQQNQKLLEDIAMHLRSICPTSIVDDFVKRLSECVEDVIVNDDLRDPDVDLPVLRRLGFKILRVSADAGSIAARLDQRQDLQTQRTSTVDQTAMRIRPDHVLVNCGTSLQNYAADVFAFTDTLLQEASGDTSRPFVSPPLRQVELWR
ncbi:hypothetical protein [Roseobacter weihaiensis]|uniref:hypothetical protein n=1 Tax=Roseobacter weihaiensis TaxID=2763262 RepID=UPI001D0AB137|nr:hypothetical protein [Roseobacter sp. H9]